MSRKGLAYAGSTRIAKAEMVEGTATRMVGGSATIGRDVVGNVAAEMSTRRTGPATEIFVSMVENS